MNGTFVKQWAKVLSLLRKKAAQMRNGKEELYIVSFYDIIYIVLLV